MFIRVWTAVGFFSAQDFKGSTVAQERLSSRTCRPYSPAPELHLWLLCGGLHLSDVMVLMINICQDTV